MPASLCTVSGTVMAPDGTPVPEMNLRFMPAPAAVRADGASAFAPRPVNVVAGGDATITVQLKPGVYSVRARERTGREHNPFLIEVPKRETAVLADIMVPMRSPQSVYDAAASARQAAVAAGEVQSALDEIKGLEGTDLTALAEMVNEVQGFIPRGGDDGDVLVLEEGTPAWRRAPHNSVSSVNGQTGVVALTATDVGAATAAQGGRADSALQPGAAIPWADLVGAPGEFPPEAHGHSVSEVSGLQQALDGKAAVDHTHSIDQIAGFPQLSAVATSGAYGDLGGRPEPFSGAAPGLVPAPGVGALDRFLRADGQFVAVPGSGGAGTVGWDDVTEKPGWTTAFDGSFASLSGRPELGTAASLDAGAFATASQGALASTALQPGAQLPWQDVTGRPAAFPPEAHLHTVSQISDFPVLGEAAGLNIGVAAGTVAAGDHFHGAATQAIDGFMSATDKAKLDGIAAGATANQSDVLLLDRSNHTGAQPVATISGLEDLLAGKQDILISGVSIRTVNGQSLLGSGDLAIQGSDAPVLGRGCVYDGGGAEGAAGFAYDGGGA